MAASPGEIQLTDELLNAASSFDRDCDECHEEFKPSAEHSLDRVCDACVSEHDRPQRLMDVHDALTAAVLDEQLDDGDEQATVLYLIRLGASAQVAFTLLVLSGENFRLAWTLFYHHAVSWHGSGWWGGSYDPASVDPAFIALLSAPPPLQAPAFALLRGSAAVAEALSQGELTCSVCHVEAEVMADEERLKLYVVTRCSPTARHVFHKACLKTWLRQPQTSCPVCRTNIVGPPAGSASLETDLGSTPTASADNSQQ